MRNWSLPTESARQAPIPQAGVFPEGRLVLVCCGSFRSSGEVATRGRADGARQVAANTYRCSVSHQCKSLARLRAGTGLLAEPEPRDCRAIPLNVLAGKVRKQAPALSNELEKSTA
jgi:hypothetical protein